MPLPKREKSHPRLLTRDEFRAAVFARDGEACVVCRNSDTPIDAHHIIERRIFPDGGYYLDNGATVCGEHHLMAEQTTLSCEELRNLCGITRVILPPHLYEDQTYDKWSNLVLPNQQRLRGELFYDESVQKALRAGGVLHLFDSSVVKYPRTLHLPWSPGRTKDDRVLEDTSKFDGRETIVSIKCDGENSTIYRNGFHARSIDSDSHPSQTHVRALQGRIGHELPDGWRIVVENVYATHSIRYDDLESFEFLISVWTDKNVCLSWSDTVEYAALLDIPTVPVIWRGAFDREAIEAAYAPYAEKHEGYVVRIAESFAYGDFKNSVAKWVRPNHVAATVHNWRSGWYPSPENVNRKR